MEKLNLTPQILKKFNIQFDVVKQNDVLSGSEIKIRDVYTNNCQNTQDIFPRSEYLEDSSFMA